MPPKSSPIKNRPIRKERADFDKVTDEAEGDGGQTMELFAHPTGLVMVESSRDINGVVSTERRYYISSRLADAAHLGAVVRGHWGVENGLHWSLDVVFGEDQARMRQGNSAENFSILRRIALNLFRQDKSVKAGIKNRRLLAACDDAYRQKLLNIQAVA
jgi:predicted transposase YbfD/YdcC